MAILVVSTDAGDIAIQEHEISTITAAELCQLRISRADLRRLFAEAAKLLQGIKPRDRALLVAIRALDGNVCVCQSPIVSLRGCGQSGKASKTVNSLFALLRNRSL